MGESSRVLYRAEPAVWAWIVYIAVPLLLVMAPLGLFVLLLVQGAEAVALIVAGLLLALSVLVVLAIGLYALRRSFTVTTDGLEIRSFLVTRRIPWSDVSVIEQEEGYLWEGAVRVRLRDGRSHVGPLTDIRTGIMRRRPQLRPGPDGLYDPARAAIDAHRRFLAGEFR